MSQRKTSQVNIRLDQDTLDRVGNAAVTENCTRTELIRRGLLMILDHVEGKTPDPVSAHLDRVLAYLESRPKPVQPRYGFAEQSHIAPYLKPDGMAMGGTAGGLKNDVMKTGGKNEGDAEEMEEELRKLADIINHLIARGWIDTGFLQNQK